MRSDDVQVETPAQWLEHTEAWRFAHLDQAPSESFRRAAIREHEAPSDSTAQNSRRSRHRWPRRSSTS